MAKSTTKLYQLKVTLKHSKPAIWRRLLVRADIKLPKLHDILQVAMGWHDCHLHEFEASGNSYGVPDPEFGSEDMIDERKVKLSELLTTEKQRLIYTYDFGDYWQHEILLEKVLVADSAPLFAQCLAGKRAAPPEDCGGIGGYAELIRTASDPKHPDHDDLIEWLPEDFDPDSFSPELVNEVLASLR